MDALIVRKRFCFVAGVLTALPQGSMMFPGLSQAAGSAASTFSGGPKRIIFFLQNQGFDPATCIPAGTRNSGSFAGAKLPEPAAAGNIATLPATPSALRGVFRLGLYENVTG